MYFEVLQSISGYCDASEGFMRHYLYILRQLMLFLLAFQRKFWQLLAFLQKCEKYKNVGYLTRN